MGATIVKFSTLLLSGLIAGTFFYGTFCVLPAFYEVSPNIHLTFRTTLMQHNKVLVMLLVLLALVFNIIYLINVRKIKVVRTLCFIALVFTIISLVVTRFGSVPINMMMKTWPASNPPADWLVVLNKWDFYNVVRTITSIGSFILLLVASEMQKNKKATY